MNSWGVADDPFRQTPPPVITYRDALELLKSRIPVRSTATFASRVTVFPADRGAHGSEAAGARSARALRLATADFFPMFAAPFRYGGPWSREADARGRGRGGDQLGAQRPPVRRRQQRRPHASGWRTASSRSWACSSPGGRGCGPSRWSPIRWRRRSRCSSPSRSPGRWRSSPPRCRWTGGRRSPARRSSPTPPRLMIDEALFLGFWAELPDARAAQALQELRRRLRRRAEEARPLPASAQQPGDPPARPDGRAARWCRRRPRRWRSSPCSSWWWRRST